MADSWGRWGCDWLWGSGSILVFLPYPIPPLPSNSSNPSSHRPGVASFPFHSPSTSSPSSPSTTFSVPTSTSAQAPPPFLPLNCQPLLLPIPNPPLHTPLPPQPPSRLIDHSCIICTPPFPQHALNPLSRFETKSPHNNPSSNPPKATVIILAFNPTSATS